jgi:hypothetical protein
VRLGIPSSRSAHGGRKRTGRLFDNGEKISEPGPPVPLTRPPAIKERSLPQETTISNTTDDQNNIQTKLPETPRYASPQGLGPIGWSFSRYTQNHAGPTRMQPRDCQSCGR